MIMIQANCQALRVGCALTNGAIRIPQTLVKQSLDVYRLGAAIGSLSSVEG